MTVLVTGATGQIGTSLVAELLERGVAVRAMVRRESDRVAFAGHTQRSGAGAAGSATARVEGVVADFDDRDALDRALAGVDALFLNTPSSEQAAARQIRCADRAVASGVGRLVLLSQLGATADSPVRFLRWHAEVEAHVRSLPFAAVTVLRPNLFLQGLLAMAGPIAAHGAFGAPIGDARVSMVDTRDIAAVAARVLAEHGHAGATYTLTGPSAITHAEVAAALTAATGRPVAFGDVAPADFAAALDGVLPDWQRDGVVEDYAHYRRGEAAAVDPAVPSLLGRPARGIEGFARDHATRFAPAA